MKRKRGVWGDIGVLTEGLHFFFLKCWEGMRIHRTLGGMSFWGKRGKMGDIDKLIGSGKERKLIISVFQEVGRW